MVTLNTPDHAEKIQKKKKSKNKLKETLADGNFNAPDHAEKKLKKKDKLKNKPTDVSSVNESTLSSGVNGGHSLQDTSVNLEFEQLSKMVTKKPSFRLDKIRSLLETKPQSSVGPTPQPKVSSPKKAAPLSLKERMEEQLKAARFRYLNEQLYTNDSKSAQELFAEDEEAFQVYHHGYQAQVSKWPANPVDRAISYVKTR